MKIPLKSFKNPEIGKIRVVEKDGEIWFVGKDVAEVLGYKNTRDALHKHLDKEDRRFVKCDTLGGKQNMVIINESGLYSLILSSKLPSAKKFKKWVTSEVLPSIRKHGAYMTDNLLDKIINNPDFFQEVLLKLKEESTKRKKAEEKLAILTHTEKLYTTTEIAKELGFKSAKEFNKKLQKLGLQYKVNGTWVLKAPYADKGYTSIKQYILESGSVIYDRKWTQFGRDFLLDLFNRSDNE